VIFFIILILDSLNYLPDIMIYELKYLKGLVYIMKKSVISRLLCLVICAAVICGAGSTFQFFDEDTIEPICVVNPDDEFKPDKE